MTGLILLSPDLFWPGPEPSDSGTARRASTCIVPVCGNGGATAEPYWPHMETIKIKARMISPDGRFYYPPELCRMVLFPPPENSPALNDLVIRVSRAMVRMPKLKRLSIRFPEVESAQRDESGRPIKYDRDYTIARGAPCRLQGVNTCTDTHSFDAPWRMAPDLDEAKEN